MNYYEELGLERSATPEQIHSAYRNLSRMLHPDQHQDGEMRRLAECQMRRLNAVYAVLSDEPARLHYDAEISQRPAAVPSRRPARSRTLNALRWGAGASVAAAGVVATVLYLTVTPASETPPLPSARNEESAHPAMEKEPDRSPKRDHHLAANIEIAKLRRQLESLRLERDAAVERAKQTQLESADNPHVPVSILDAQPVKPAPEEPPATPKESSPGSGLAGTWLYVAPLELPDTSLYPPESIEAVVRERDGLLFGDYRARYVVSDRAISPEVAFRFEGAALGRAAEFPWTGAGGARGKVRLRLIRDGQLELTWSADRLGTQMGLSAGTAILSRQ
jgi:curved DNA-binding protein CbpA